MKALIILVVLIASPCAFGLLEEFLRLAEPLLSPLESQLRLIPSLRQKRAIVNVSLEDPDDCVRGCYNDLFVRLITGEVNASLDKKKFTEDLKLKNLCDGFEPTASCISTCPTSKLSKLVQHFLPMKSMVCHLGDDSYQEILQSLACINESKNLIAEKCGEKCFSDNDEKDIFESPLDVVREKSHEEPASQIKHESTISISLFPSFAVYQNNKTFNSENLEGGCRAIACMDDCDDSVIKEACGPKAVRIENKLTGVIVRALKGMFEDLNALAREPEACKRYYE